MILPQLEQGTHGVEVIGMFFFDDNTYLLRAGDPLGERLAAVAEREEIMLMLCDRCAIERSLAEGEPGDCWPSGTVRECGSAASRTSMRRSPVTRPTM